MTKISVKLTKQLVKQMFKGALSRNFYLLFLVATLHL